MEFPAWLHVLSILWLSICGACFFWVIADELAGHPQNMWIMNLVWPITMLYAGPLGLIAYYRAGRLGTRARVQRAKERGEKPPNQKKPFWQSVGIGATHCGSGCTLGDLVAESFLILVPFTLFGMKIFGAWALDYALALIFGVAFQYFTIKPMKHLSRREGIKAAIKADFLSLTAWQVGMYGWMAISTFVIFGRELDKTTPVFWFMMQVAMLLGFLTSYPVNWWLLRKKIKEAM